MIPEVAVALPKIDYSDQRWAQAKKKVTEILIRQAKSGTPKITYTDLANELGWRINGQLVAGNDPRLWSLLCDISEEEDAGGRGMLSVIVVERGGKMMPGDYFFTFAKEKLKHRFKDRTTFWIKEYERVLDFWKKN